jgi:DNA polymerase III epsilon subunit-like protein
MDRSLDSNVLVKITVVDDDGKLILDTLVNPGVPITQSCYQIHGIRPEWLNDAPQVSEVRSHLLQICSKSNFVGHSVRMDLKVIGFENKITPYLDTGFFEDMGLSEFD